MYGQEKEPATYRLAKMNLALRGISHNPLELTRDADVAAGANVLLDVVAQLAAK